MAPWGAGWRGNGLPLRRAKLGQAADRRPGSCGCGSTMAGFVLEQAGATVLPHVYEQVAS
jgi:hypothetical protein